MQRCPECGDEVEHLFQCAQCGISFCIDCQLHSDHKTTKNPNKVKGDGTSVYLFLDEDPLEKTNVENLRAIIGYISEKDRWEMLRCNETSYFPDETFIYVHQWGEKVYLDEIYYSGIGQLVQPHELEQSEYTEEDVMPFPESLAGKNYKEGSMLEEGDIDKFLMSLNQD